MQSVPANVYKRIDEAEYVRLRRVIKKRASEEKRAREESQRKIEEQIEALEVEVDKESLRARKALEEIERKIDRIEQDALKLPEEAEE